MRSQVRSVVAAMRRESVRGLVTACLLGAACNGDSGSPTAPSRAARTVAVTYPTEHGTIYIGDRVQFRATVSSSAGGTQAAATAWESDAPAVATVSSSGLVAAVSAGEATITAEVPAHGRGSTRIRVFPEFHGHWEGDLNVTRISVPPDWRELGEEDCDSLADCASWIPLAVDFGQDDARVTGSVKSTFTASPNYEWTVQSGSVSIDGTLMLTTDELSFRPPSDAITVRASLMRWESRADTPGVMTGTVVVQYSADRLDRSFGVDRVEVPVCQSVTRFRMVSVLATRSA